MKSDNKVYKNINNDCNFEKLDKTFSNQLNINFQHHIGWELNKLVFLDLENELTTLDDLLDNIDNIIYEK